MGQKLGKALFIGSVKPFVNLSAPSIRKLWQTFQLISEGWGCSRPLFQSVLECIGQEVGGDIKELAKELFTTLDTDNNDIVDGLEALATLVRADPSFREHCIARIVSPALYLRSL